MKRLLAAIFAVFLIAPTFAPSVVFAQTTNSQSLGEKAIADVVYWTINGQELKLNLYLPTRNGETLKNVPLLIWIDSGGYESGAPGDGAFWRSTGALQKGFAIASVSHRSMKNGDVFPKQIQDVKAAVRFLRANAGKYGLDSNRFAAMGASSGGHLACMLGLSDKFREFDVGENLDQSSQVQVVVDVCGSTYLPLVYVNYPSQDVVGIISRVSSIEFDSTRPVWEQPNVMTACMKYSPIAYLDAEFSSTLIIQGSEDKLINPSQSLLFYEGLKKYGVKTEIKMVPGGEHYVFAKIPLDELGKTLYDFLDWK